MKEVNDKNKSGRQFIKIKGAAEHNLKHIDLNIPRNEFVVVTGLIGSGKSTLAFDTKYTKEKAILNAISSAKNEMLLPEDYALENSGEFEE